MGRQKLDRLSARLFAANERNPTTGSRRAGPQAKDGRSRPRSAQITRPLRRPFLHKKILQKRRRRSDLCASFPFLRVPTAEGMVRDDGPDLWPRQGRKSLNLHGDSRLTDRRHVVTAAPIPPIPPLSDRPIGRTPRKRGFVFLGGMGGTPPSPRF